MDRWRDEVRVVDPYHLLCCFTSSLFPILAPHPMTSYFRCYFSGARVWFVAPTWSSRRCRESDPTTLGLVLEVQIWSFDWKRITIDDGVPYVTWVQFIHDTTSLRMVPHVVGYYWNFLGPDGVNALNDLLGRVVNHDRIQLSRMVEEVGVMLLV